MKKAVIDIGSNSILLLLAERKGDTYEPVFEDVREPRLGESLPRTGIISAEALERTSRALYELFSEATQFSPDEIIVFGTSPFREAKNAESVRVWLENILGYSIRVLSPEDEARLSFEATLHFFPFESNIVHLELGGLTTELIAGNKNGIIHRKTFPLGALRITEMFNLRPPVCESNISSAFEFALSQFSALDIKGNFPLIATGGTITTLACYIAKDRVYVSNKYHRMRLTREEIQEAIEVFACATLDKIKELLPFAPSRADIILGGGIVFLAALEWLGRNELIVSERGVRWGVLIRSDMAIAR